jgi:hypothetical protein
MVTPRPAVRPGWRRRRNQIGAVGVLAVLVAALVANSLIARQYTPEGAVRQYLSALQAGDTAKAWEAIQVTAPTTAVAAQSIDRSAMQSALTGSKPDIKSFTVVRTRQLDASRFSVEVTYDTSSGSKEAKFITQRSGHNHFVIYPDWHLVITPTILQVNLPKGSNGIAVDGKALAVPEGKSAVAVLPLPHRVEINGTAMLEPQTVSIDAFGSLGVPVRYQPKLTAEGVVKAKASVNAAIVECARQTTSTARAGSGCPQNLGLGQPTSGQWRIVGDPTQDLTLGLDQDQNLAGLGHYQMVFAYQKYGMQHQPLAEGYSASLALTAADVAVSGIAPTREALGLQRPTGATDQAIRDVVTQGFAHCVKSTADVVADCPQQLIDLQVSNVSWSMSGDPLAGATISFDSSSGLITVQGSNPMAATYRSVGKATTKASFTRTYKAYLLWDGQSLELVTISGVI